MSESIRKARDGRRYRSQNTGDSEAPSIPTRVMEWLEEAYAQRPRKDGESEFDFARYAGKVELVQQLRIIHNDPELLPDFLSTERE